MRRCAFLNETTRLLRILLYNPILHSHCLVRFPLMVEYSPQALLLGVLFGRELNVGSAEICVHASSEVHQSANGLFTISFATGILAMLGNHCFCEIADLKVLLAGAFFNHLVHIFTSRGSTLRLRYSDPPVSQTD
jgi:hypothetical protein